MSIVFKFCVDYGLPLLDNYHQSIWQLINRMHSSMCPGLPKPNDQLARISTDQCLTVCDDTHLLQCPTLNKPQDLYPHYLAASFSVQ